MWLGAGLTPICREISWDTKRRFQFWNVKAAQDVTAHVSVYSGRYFWAWLNYGEANTQEWVLEGIIGALSEAKIHETTSELLKTFKTGVVDKHERDIREKGKLDWHKLLKKING